MDWKCDDLCLLLCSFFQYSPFFYHSCPVVCSHVVPDIVSSVKQHIHFEKRRVEWVKILSVYAVERRRDLSLPLFPTTVTALLLLVCLVLWMHNVCLLCMCLNWWADGASLFQEMRSLSLSSTLLCLPISLSFHFVISLISCHPFFLLEPCVWLPFHFNTKRKSDGGWKREKTTERPKLFEKRSRGTGFIWFQCHSMPPSTIASSPTHFSLFLSLSLNCHVLRSSIASLRAGRCAWMCMCLSYCWWLTVIESMIKEGWWQRIYIRERGRTQEWGDGGDDDDHDDNDVGWRWW